MYILSLIFIKNDLQNVIPSFLGYPIFQKIWVLNNGNRIKILSNLYIRYLCFWNSRKFPKGDKCSYKSLISRARIRVGEFIIIVFIRRLDFFCYFFASRQKSKSTLFQRK